MKGISSWECPKVIQANHPVIQKTNRYCAEYARIKGDGKRRTLYWWDLVSAEDTKVSGHIFDTVDLLGNIAGYKQQHISIFTDGSGGSAQAMAGSEDADGHGLYQMATRIKRPYMVQEEP